jgi:RNA polymerase sigma-70 factor (ECF subfamily)
MDLGPAKEPVESNLYVPAEAKWVEPMPDSLLESSDPAEIAITRDSVRLALVAALQHLPARQRAALILHEVLRWEASEIAELLDTSVAAVNSSLQRARATLARRNASMAEQRPPLSAEERELLDRYVRAFERYEVSGLVSLIRDDATQSMPPFDMWLSGRDDIFDWWFGPGIGCRGSRVVPVGTANGSPAFGQYKPDPNGGYTPWALQVLELSEGRIGEFTFFLDTDRLFPLFGLPLHLDS